MEPIAPLVLPTLLPSTVHFSAAKTPPRVLLALFWKVYCGLISIPVFILTRMLVIDYHTMLWVTIALSGLYFVPRYYLVGHFIPTRMLVICCHTTMLWVTIALTGLYFGTQFYLHDFVGFSPSCRFSIKYRHQRLLLHCFFLSSVLFLVTDDPVQPPLPPVFGAVPCWFSISSSDRLCLAYCRLL